MTKKVIRLLMMITPLIIVISFVFFSSSLPQVNAGSADNEQLAKEVYGTLDKHCSECHGENGSVKNLMLISPGSREKLVNDQKKVIPNDPLKSRIYIRVTGSDPNANNPMPPSYAKDPAPLSNIEKDSIRRWIKAGAPNWQAASNTNRSTISNAAILATIQNDELSLSPSARLLTRYFVLTNQYNSGTSEVDLQSYRVAFFQLINSLPYTFCIGLVDGG